MTGGCAYYDMVECEKWKTVCNKCPQRGKYLDTSKFMHLHKRKWFGDVPNMTLVANSNWTAEQAGMSYMSQYPIKVIYNGIDLSVFKPTESDFRAKYGLENKKIVLDDLGCYPLYADRRCCISGFFCRNHLISCDKYREV